MNPAGSISDPTLKPEVLAELPSFTDIKENSPWQIRMRLLRVGVAGLLLALVIIFQWLGGAYLTEFAGYPDEGAHYITGLMLRDYLADGHFKSFKQFAENYYLHYPKVALGHWPPFFYIVEAAWTLVFPTSRASMLLMMALITMFMGFTLYRILEDEFGPLLAAGASLILVSLPVMQQYSGMVMADTLVALLSLWATLEFARFMDRSTWRSAVWFGLLASATILTKGTGIALALVPPLALLFTGRLALLRRAQSWLPALIVACLCGPWYWVTRHMLPDTWEQPEPGLKFALRAARFYTLHSLKIFGIAILALAILGLFVKLFAPPRRQVSSTWAALAALLFATAVLACVVPAGLEERFLIPIAPAVLAFAVAGLDHVARTIFPQRLDLRKRQLIWLITLAVIFFASTFAIPKTRSWGFATVAEDIISTPQFNNAVLLVSTDAAGDGMFVSEMAMHERRPGHYILRATKVLCDCNWSGKQHVALYATPSALMNYLDQSPVQVVVEDRSVPARKTMEFQKVLADTIQSYPQRWTLLASYPVTRDGVRYPDGLRVYTVSGTNPHARVTIDLRRMLDKTIEMQPR